MNASAHSGNLKDGVLLLTVVVKPRDVDEELFILPCFRGRQGKYTQGGYTSSSESLERLCLVLNSVRDDPRLGYRSQSLAPRCEERYRVFADHRSGIRGRNQLTWQSA
jgi:hypothetical protein